MVMRDYLQTKRRWLPFVCAGPIVAGLATAAVIHFQPPRTTAQVTVSVPPVVATNDSAVALYVARVRQAFALNTVQSEIAKEALIAPTDFGGVTVERSGQSDQFVLTAVTTAAAGRAVPIAETAVKVGTAFVASQSFKGASAATEVAHKAFVQAQVDLSSYQSEIGDLDPTSTYGRLRSGQAYADPQEENKLAGQVRRFNELKGNLQTAGNVLNQAQAASTKSSAEILAAEGGNYIMSSKMQDEPFPGARYFKPAGLAAVLTFMVGLGLTLLPDLYSSIRGGAAAVAGLFAESGPRGLMTVEEPGVAGRTVFPDRAQERADSTPTPSTSGAAKADVAVTE